MHLAKRALALLFVFVSVSQLQAQPAAKPAPLQLALHASEAAPLDAEQLRAQLERELGVVVVPASADGTANGATLRIDAPSLQAVRVSFAASERTVDLSTSGAHAVETLALVAAGMMRDEASDLLATLRTAAPAAEAPPAAALVEPRGCAADRSAKRVPLALNLVPYLGTSTLTGVDVEQTFALHLIGGAARSTRGFELAGVFNLESRALCGVQVAGVANIVSGPVQGVQLSFLNIGGRVDGAQLSFLNLGTGSLHGLQLGFANVVTSDVDGAQAGFLNLAARTVDGLQLGFVNLATDAVDGAQIGFLNGATGEARGLQLGFANITSAQSRGLQLGFVNVAEDADAAIGVVSIHTRGRTQLDLWVTDAGLVMAGLVHGGRRFHNLYGAGFTLRNGRGVFAFAWGIGARMHDARPWQVDVDAVAYGLLSSQPKTGTSTTESASAEGNEANLASILQLRVPIAYRLTPAVSLFAAPALNVSIGRSDEELADPGFYGAELTNDSSDETVTIWPGLSLGARFF